MCQPGTLNVKLKVPLRVVKPDFTIGPFRYANGFVEGYGFVCVGLRIGRAEGLCKKLGHTGAVAFSRSGDPATGDFREATVLRKFGDVPDDLSAL